MTRQQFFTSSAIFALIVFVPLISLFASTQKVFAQTAGYSPGYYFDDGSNVLCVDQFGNDPNCVYWNGTQFTLGPSDPGAPPSRTPGYYYNSNDAPCPTVSDQMRPNICYYWDGTTIIDNPPANPGDTTIDVPPPGAGSIGITIPNPLRGSTTLYGFIKDIINGVVVPIGGVLAVLYIMYAGFLMVTARGSEEQIKDGRRAFTHAAIGTAILLGAWVIATVIETTINSLTG